MLAQLAMDFVQAVFVLIEQHQHARRAVHDLAATAPSRSSRRRRVTSTALPRTQRVQQMRQRGDRVAPEQVFDRDVARVRDGLPCNQIRQIRNQSDVNRERFQKLDDAFAVGGGGGRHGDEHFACLRVVQQRRQRSRRVYVDAVDRAPLQQRIVVEECHRHVIALLLQASVASSTPLCPAP